MSLKLQTLNPKLRQRIQEQIANEDGVCVYGADLSKPIGTKVIIESGKKPKRIRQDSKPLMNKLETEYWGILCNLFGEHVVKPQSLRFKIGNGIWFKPDFAVFHPYADDANINKAFRCYEVKGPHAFRGGFENLKVAANQWPQVQFILVWKQDRKWQEQLILK